MSLHIKSWVWVGDDLDNVSENKDFLWVRKYTDTAERDNIRYFGFFAAEILQKCQMDRFVNIYL